MKSTVDLAKLTHNMNNLNFNLQGLDLEKAVAMSNKEKEANGSSQIVNNFDSNAPPTTTKIPKKFNSVRNAFLLLGIIGKFTGLFPTYRLTFDEHTKCKRQRLLGYIYSALILGCICTGLVLCVQYTPAVLEGMMPAGSKGERHTTDGLVIMAVFYTSMGMSILTLLTIPRKVCHFIYYIQHFANVDKILQFPEQAQAKELKFGRVLAFLLVGSIFGMIGIFFCLFILESPEIPKTSLDYMMVAVEVFAEMTNITPTFFIIFFLYSIKLRLLEFNRQIELIILPITPSCVSCINYSDYGNELVGQVCYRKSNLLGEDLEKMRILHEEIRALVDLTSEILGSHLIRDFLYSTIGMVLFTYFILFVRGPGFTYWFVFPVFDAFIVVKMLLLSSCAHLITKQGSASVKVLNKASTRHLQPDCAFQLQMFMKTLDLPMSITAAGYFTVNRNLITSILGAITTYFIILVQFKLDDLRAYGQNN